jgi:hypothetical protein
VIQIFGSKSRKRCVKQDSALSGEPLKSEINAASPKLISFGILTSASLMAWNLGGYLNLVGILSPQKYLFFLDLRYAHPSTDAERRLNEALRELPRLVTDKTSPVWLEVQQLLQRLGLDPKQD